MLSLFTNIILADEGNTAGGGCGNNPASTIILVVLIVAIFAVTIIMPMFTGRKRQKEANEMLESLALGDEIMTRGGVLGTIVELKTHESGEKLMVIETGSGAEKTTMTFTVQALLINYTKTKQRQEQIAKQKEEKDNKSKKDNKDNKDNKEKENEAAIEEKSEAAPEENNGDENNNNNNNN